MPPKTQERSTGSPLTDMADLNDRDALWMCLAELLDVLVQAKADEKLGSPVAGSMIRGAATLEALRGTGVSRDAELGRARKINDAAWNYLVAETAEILARPMPRSLPAVAAARKELVDAMGSPEELFASLGRAAEVDAITMRAHAARERGDDDQGVAKDETIDGLSAVEVLTLGHALYTRGEKLADAVGRSPKTTPHLTHRAVQALLKFADALDDWAHYLNAINDDHDIYHAELEAARSQSGSNP